MPDPIEAPQQADEARKQITRALAFKIAKQIEEDWREIESAKMSANEIHSRLAAIFPAERFSVYQIKNLIKDMGKELPLTVQHPGHNWQEFLELLAAFETRVAKLEETQTILHRMITRIEQCLQACEKKEADRDRGERDILAAYGEVTKRLKTLEDEVRAKPKPITAVPSLSGGIGPNGRRM